MGLFLALLMACLGLGRKDKMFDIEVTARNLVPGDVSWVSNSWSTKIKGQGTLCVPAGRWAGRHKAGKYKVILENEGSNLPEAQICYEPEGRGLQGQGSLRILPGSCPRLQQKNQGSFGTRILGTGKGHLACGSQNHETRRDLSHHLHHLLNYTVEESKSR